MSLTKIKVNKSGMDRILKSPEMQRLLLDRTAKIARAAGLGRTRARGTVFTKDELAKRAEATDRALSRAIDAGR